ncbi:bifunctional protein tyrosine phosphatase family protein/NAD(P)/FAD-dependent oxidoreductase [Gluconobacter kondonii]|uniref:bifunctional protein tyrosine phosphatase family protein/NAD(P)/FAD-dependent oxidoreductase n=1 Tax=Gluconobacter kondonii TaxID=941463 RepID=UPI001B8B5835|nr:bifunctional protein tyrosine phosphatase family protein/NAD(P)/FAD-dependent oxidoreductase [Gluconobacter kondonii]MBS1079774.1 TIGR01244 family phosphatase [Gluconobacter kondonii]MBS1082591.1 TIGR01244 family phosphatase [Gluconobacter kondonii]
MPTRHWTDSYAISPQISVQDIADLKAEGFHTILCFRPDGEAPDQPDMKVIEAAAKEAGLAFAAIPVKSGTVPSEAQVAETRQVLATLPAPVVGYCRSGTRAGQIWALAEAGKRPAAEIFAAADKAGVDISGIRARIERVAAPAAAPRKDAAHFQVLIIGGGAGGLSTAGSLLKRNRNLSIGVVEPSNEHFYQPGWTLVGGGVFQAAQTRRKEADVMPKDVVWVKQAAKLFRPDVREVVLTDGTVVSYDALVVATGITLNWDAIPGLAETLGKNGVTSNYRFDLAPYTWQLVQQLKGGTAIFTQPPMPIKCAGAPQKAVYLSCDAWKRRGVLDNISVEFDTATPGLFGVKDFVPPLMEYIKRYHVGLHTGSKLVEVDGPNRKAVFERKVGENVERVERTFDMLHVVPPQSAPQVIRDSALSGSDGFVEVNPATLQHVRFPDVFALGDVIGTSCAKTAAAVRVQAPVVATNVLAFLKHQGPVSEYEGYGACPLTVENGRIVLAEFSYGGKLTPTLPKWLLNGQKPTRLAWWLKKYVMPLMYWDGMLKGRELMVAPKPLNAKKGG